MKADDNDEITRLLEEWQQGSAEALETLLPLVHRELRNLAARYLRKERAGHTLQPTALVNEAYLRLLGKPPGELKDPAHFFAVAAQSMRRILVDHARRHRAEKRVGTGATTWPGAMPFSKGIRRRTKNTRGSSPTARLIGERLPTPLTPTQLLVIWRRAIVCSPRPSGRIRKTGCSTTRSPGI